jgi:hypothetical protein
MEIDNQEKHFHKIYIKDTDAASEITINQIDTSK